MDHLAENHILTDSQHGFREGRSCLTNLLETLETWMEILDQKDGLDVAYLDFRKAFDLVSHQHLLYKMSKYGITQQVLNWVTSFLHERTQRVVIRGTASEPFDVTSGVPQGSVLGPVLFLIYINDLPLEVISPVSLFADDSKVFSRIISEKNKKRNTKKGISNINGNEILQRDLDNIGEWADRWKMEFNVDKCKIMHLGYTNPKHTYSMGGADLTVTSKEKDLGVLIDDELKFDSHIKEIVNKANRMLGLIKIAFAGIDKVMFKNIYPVLIRPQLEYCVQVWSPHLVKDIKLLEGVQRRATKLVPELRNLPYEERLERLELTTLTQRRHRGDMIQTYKLLTRKEDINPDKLFKLARRGRGNGLKIYKKRFHTDVRKFHFSQRVINPWNKLKRKVVLVDKTSTFKLGFDGSQAASIARRARARDTNRYGCM